MKIIRKKLARKITAWLIAVSLPLMTIAGVWVVAYEIDRVEQMTIDRGTVAAEAGAVAYGLILEHGVAAGAITREDIAHPKYTPFEYAMPTDIPRYHDGVDKYTDSAGVRELSDGVLGTSGDFIYAVGSDVGTYIPTTNGKLDHEPTGDPKVDGVRSRQKRKYLDKLHITAAASATTLVQPYYRDTGDPCWDISAPVWVKIGADRIHWGSFRVGVSRVRIAQYKIDLAERLASILGAAVAILLLAIWAMVRSHTRGLERLTQAATDVSHGERLDRPLRRESPDEVGDLTESFNRMRQSLHLAMRRMSHPTDFHETSVE